MGKATRTKRKGGKPSHVKDGTGEEAVLALRGFTRSKYVTPQLAAMREEVAQRAAEHTAMWKDWIAKAKAAKEKLLTQPPTEQVF